MIIVIIILTVISLIGVAYLSHDIKKDEQKDVQKKCQFCKKVLKNESSYMDYCETCYNSLSIVAQKMLLYATSLKFVGYIFAILSIVFGIISSFTLDIGGLGFITGMFVGICVIGYTSDRALNLKGKANIIKLLEDIKNKD